MADAELEFLRRQHEEIRKKLSVIRTRINEFAATTPPDLIEQERRTKERIADLELQIAARENRGRDLPPEATEPEISEEMIDPAKLRRNIVAHFDKDDMEILCHDLDLPYGKLSRPREDTTALQIVNYCKKRGRLVELLNYCQRKHSHVDW